MPAGDTRVAFSGRAGISPAHYTPGSKHTYHLVTPVGPTHTSLVGKTSPWVGHAHTRCYATHAHASHTIMCHHTLLGALSLSLHGCAFMWSHTCRSHLTSAACATSEAISWTHTGGQSPHFAHTALHLSSHTSVAECEHRSLSLPVVEERYSCCPHTHYHDNLTYKHVTSSLRLVTHRGISGR